MHEVHSSHSQFTVTLHITNGSHAGDKLRSFVDGPVALACDVLHEGPCPPVDGDAWHEVRGQFLAGYAGRTADELASSLAADDQAIIDACVSAQRHDIVLWFEHDLFDQLAIIRTLDLIARQRPRGTGGSPRASLICIDRFPGVDRFLGLGQLTADQLATLRGTASTVTAGHYTLSADAWRAFRSPDPRELLRMAEGLAAAELPVSEGGPALRFLGDALLRFLAEYPSTTNGLSRTQELTLEALLDGPVAAGALFAATQAREARPFLGDTTFFETLERLASARTPLVTLDAGPDEADPRRRLVVITATGRDVLAGRADHVRLNGIDIWRGGVHLAGSNRSPWRWDARRETLVS
jgi:hypothetical protein